MQIRLVHIRARLRDLVRYVVTIGVVRYTDSSIAAQFLRVAFALLLSPLLLLGATGMTFEAAPWSRPKLCDPGTSLIYAILPLI